MPLINFEVERKARYEKYNGKNEDVPFKTIVMEYLHEELCEECKGKGKKRKNLCFDERYFSINDICDKCRKMVSFQRNNITRGI